ISAADLELGLYDGATVETFLVDWRNPADRLALARSVIGRITRRDGAFTAELVSPMAALDRPAGRWFRRDCDAELGDAACGFDLDRSGFHAAGTVIAVEAPALLRAAGLAGFADGWFSCGRLVPEGGEPVRVLRHLNSGGGEARLTLGRAAALAPGQGFTLFAGCDKRFGTCRDKFGNALNF